MSSFLVGVLAGAGGLATLCLIAIVLLVRCSTGDETDIFGDRLGEGQRWQD